MYAKNYLKAFSEVKKKEKTILTEATKGTIVGSSIGAGIGLFIGFGRHKNLLMSGFIGAVIGGAISRIFIK